MVTDFYHPYVGGVERHVQTLSETLARRGHEVSVVTLRPEAEPEVEALDGVRVHRIQGTTQRLAGLFRQDQRRWAPPFPDPELAVTLGRIIRRERPQIVHGHDWLARSALPSRAWSGARFVQSLHYYTRSCATKLLMYRGEVCSGPGPVKCLQCAAQHYGGAKGPVVALGNWGMSAVEQAAVDMFLPVSNAVARENGLAASSLPYQVIPNFVPDENAPRATRDLQPYVDQLPPEPYLLFVGDLGHRKGADVLVQAYARLASPPPLVLIGKRTWDTPASFPQGVVALENWPHDAVMVAMERCLALVAPSVWPEPFGIVLLEAMSQGKPVIASRSGGMPDVVVDGSTGLLVPPEDADGLTCAMERVLGDSAWREELGRAGRARSANFRASTVVPRIERVYEDLWRRRRSAARDLRQGSSVDGHTAVTAAAGDDGP